MEGKCEQEVVEWSPWGIIPYWKAVNPNSLISYLLLWHLQILVLSRWEQFAHEIWGKILWIKSLSRM